MQFYGIKTKIDADGKPLSVYFPYPNGSWKIRKYSEKDFYTEGDIAQAGLFGRDKFSAGSSKFVTITEGELDAASLYSCIRSPVVSVRSASSAHHDVLLDRPWLQAFERIYLCFDGDSAGRDAARRVAALFDYDRVFHVKLTRFKDANEYLQAGAGDELKHLWWNSQHYLPETIVSSLSEFEEILNAEDQKGFPYPWRCLNDLTFGIRPSESVLVTGLEGIGKTEFLQAIEYKILKETNDNVGAIYLETPKRRHLQALAGLDLGCPVHLPTMGVSQTDVMDAVRKVVATDGRLHLFNHFGTSDPRILSDTIRFLVAGRKCRYILLDHITLAVSNSAGEDERRALDQISNELEMMVKELNFAFIFVSHVNDNGQTRGSRNMGKIADIRIDLHRDLTAEDNITRNTTSLIVSKNRFCGRTGPAGKLLFNPVAYRLEELPEAANDNGRSNIEDVD
jgi:twinkle protein